MARQAPIWLRRLASCWHKNIAKLPVVSSLYLFVLRWITKFGSANFKNQVLNSLSTATWPASILGAQQVSLGKNTRIKIYPHNGEFDFQAILAGDINYEREVFSFLDSRTNNYDAIIEIGANVGIFTLFFSEKLKAGGGQIYAFEPSRQAYARLLRNIMVNNANNISSFCVAIGSNTGFATFYEPEGHLTNGSLIPHFASNFSAQVKAVPVLVVAGAEIAELVKSEQRVLLKIDVEGHEATVLRALAPLFKKVRPDVLLEVLPGFEKQIESAIAAVADGYNRYAITANGVVYQDNLCAIDGRDCFLSTRKLDEIG